MPSSTLERIVALSPPVFHSLDPDEKLPDMRQCPIFRFSKSVYVVERLNVLRNLCAGEKEPFSPKPGGSQSPFEESERSSRGFAQG